MITGKMKVVMIISLVLVVILFLFLSNHDYKTNEPEMLFGKYCFNNGGTDSIIIYKDHTYKHKYVTGSNKVYEGTGKWKWNINEIDFHDFTFYNDKGSAGSGLWISKVESTDNEIKLIYSSENDIYYSQKLPIKK
ncbi:MAG TPA: hypothetical protein VK668_06140 [Mucilaginibacter sp.]|nr:hypothetical protein [Mucilaginibacter sp.]